MVYTSIDLFSGPGGICTGFKWGGIKPLIAVEWSYWTVQTYSASHNADIFVLDEFLAGKLTDKQLKDFFSPSDKTLLIYGDITKVTDELIKAILTKRFNTTSVDIVTGGAPCESFSLAGSRKEDDDRNLLFLNVLRIARAVDSKLFLFENVKGLFSKKMNGVKGRMFEEICLKFQEDIENKPSFYLASTNKKEVLLKASDFGVPQARERIFLLGINRKYPEIQFSYPKKTHGMGLSNHPITLADALLDLPELKTRQSNVVYNFDINEVSDDSRRKYLEIMRGIDKKFKIPSYITFSEDALLDHIAPGHIDKIQKRFQLIKQGENQRTACIRLEKDGQAYREFFPKKLYGARNRRPRLTDISFTVTSHCLDEIIHPTQDRALTPREVARLQSFPDWYQFRGPLVKFHSDVEQDLYEQIGDAIPPLLAYSISLEVVKTLKQIEAKND